MLQVGFTILEQHWDNIEMKPGVLIAYGMLRLH